MIRKAYKTLLLTLILPAVVFAQESEIRDISGFTEIEIYGDFEVEIQIDETYLVVVEGAENALSALTTDIDDGDTLVAELQNEADVRLLISLPVLESLNLYEAGEVMVADLEADDLELSIHGSGSIEAGSVVADEVDIEIAGSGEVVLNALAADRAALEVLGAGDIDIATVDIDQMEAQILGAGDISVAGQIDELELRITGAGNFGGNGLSVERLTGNIVGAGDTSFEQVEDNQLTYDEFDIGGIFDVIGAIGEHTGQRDGSDFRGDFGGNRSNGGLAGALGALTGIVAILLIFGGPIIVIAIIFAFSYRRKRLLHETLRQYSANDKQVPEEILEVLLRQGKEKNHLQSGMILLAVGAAIAVFFVAMGLADVAAIGCIPGFIGLAMLAIWKLEKKDSQDQ